MEQPNNLTPKEILELKKSVGSLESIISELYLNRKPRDLLGEEGILVRTLGVNYEAPTQYEPKYFDKRRGKEVDTEFSEVVEALEIYDKNPTRENEIELLLEVGDIIFQKEIVALKHKGNEEYVNVMDKFNLAEDYINKKLEKRNLSLDKAKRFVKVKYGARAWLGSNGHQAKDKILERQLCIEAYND